MERKTEEIKLAKKRRAFVPQHKLPLFPLLLLLPFLRARNLKETKMAGKKKYT